MQNVTCRKHLYNYTLLPTCPSLSVSKRKTRKALTPGRTEHFSHTFPLVTFNFNPWPLTCKNDLGRVKMNHHVKYLGRSQVISPTGPLKAGPHQQQCRSNCQLCCPLLRPLLPFLATKSNVTSTLLVVWTGLNGPVLFCSLASAPLCGRRCLSSSVEVCNTPRPACRRLQPCRPGDYVMPPPI